MIKKSDLLATVIQDIEQSELQTIKTSSVNNKFELSPDPRLILSLSGGVGAFFIRAILNRLNIDEHHVFKWRLENKYMQYLVLNYYCHGCMPETISLSRVANKTNGNQFAKRLFTKGFFLKATLGHGSARTNSFDRTKDFDKIFQSYKLKDGFDEEWILQQKLNITDEYRIHTFGKDIIYGLTFNLKNSGSANNYTAEEFVSDLLRKIPDNLLIGSLIGWDIGLSSSNKYYIIEANFTGYHPIYRRGFQTSGYVEDNTFGPIICAWLNNYLKYRYGTFISSIDEKLQSDFQFYNECIYYMNLFKPEHFELLKNKKSGVPLSAIIYWPDQNNQFTLNLITHLQIINLIDHYYIIIGDGYITDATSLYEKDHRIHLLAESSLFNENEYSLSKQLNFEKKKQLCHSIVLKKMKLDTAFII